MGIFNIIKNFAIVKKLYYLKSEERHIAISNINKQHYYIIRRKTSDAGFFSNWIWVAAHLGYAEKKGYIPVVDQENYKTLYTENISINGSMNVWEYYFEQPDKISLKDAYESNNYILCDLAIHSDELPYVENTIDEFELDENKLKRINAIVTRDIRLNKMLNAELEEKWGEITSKCKGIIIGVHVRGTDKIIPPEGHYKAAGIDKYINVVKELKKEYPQAAIFLCCDEKKSIEIFKGHFGDCIFFNEAYRADGDSMVGIHLEQNESVRPLHKYSLGVEVILDAYMLARCDCLVHTHSNVTNAAIILNGGKYIHRIFVEGCDK